jgi:hypothetical protein
MPHNAVAELQNMLADTPEVAERQMLTFSADSPTVKGEDAKAFTVSFRKGYVSTFEYDADSKLYSYLFNGKQMKDGLDNTPLTYANVMVIKHKYWFEDGRSNTPMIDSTGTHAVEYFIGGKHFTGRGARASIVATPKFSDDEGNPVQFTPGKTFILLPDEAREIQYDA